MLTVRPPIRPPAPFVDASRMLIEEHGEIVLLARELKDRISTWGEDSCRREELHLRKRLDAYLCRYAREVNQLKAHSDTASKASLLDDLLNHVDVTPNRQAIVQLESMFASAAAARHS